MVHLVRDARATAYSFRRKKHMPDFGDDRLMIIQPLTVSRARAELRRSSARAGSPGLRSGGQHLTGTFG